MPERSILAEPGIDRLEWFRVQPVDAVTAVAALFDEAGTAQQTQMLGNGRAGNGKGLSDVPGGKATAAEEVQDGPACGVGECAEDGFL